jgi:hypothetical protein
MDASLDGGGMLGMAGFAGLINIVTVPLLLLIGVGIYLIAKCWAASETWTLCSISTPLFSAAGILTALLNIVPLAGCITPFISIYSLGAALFCHSKPNIN